MGSRILRPLCLETIVLIFPLGTLFRIVLNAGRYFQIGFVKACVSFSGCARMRSVTQLLKPAGVRPGMPGLL